MTASNPLGTATPLTYAELLSDTVSYATAIKAVAPNTLIFGPVSYGWDGYTTLQNAPDSGRDGDFLGYYLNQTASASQAAGKRLVDVLDLLVSRGDTGGIPQATNHDPGHRPGLYLGPSDGADGRPRRGPAVPVGPDVR